MYTKILVDFYIYIVYNNTVRCLTYLANVPCVQTVPQSVYYNSMRLMYYIIYVEEYLLYEINKIKELTGHAGKE